MPTKKTYKRTVWECEVCGDTHETEKQALKCESSPGEKYHIRISGCDYGYEWEVGDILLVTIHDYTPKLAKIVSTETKYHTIYPVIRILDKNFKDQRWYGDITLLAVIDDHQMKELRAMLETAENAKIDIDPMSIVEHGGDAEGAIAYTRKDGKLVLYCKCGFSTDNMALIVAHQTKGCDQGE